MELRARAAAAAAQGYRRPRGSPIGTPRRHLIANNYTTRQGAPHLPAAKPSIVQAKSPSSVAFGIMIA